MADDVVYQAIRDALIAGWTVTQIAFENEDFQKPSPPAPWIMLEVTGSFYGQQSIGDPADNRWDADGVLWLHVFVPVGTGSSTARGYAKTLADLFRGRQLLNETLEFLDASIGLGEPGDDSGNWWRLSVSIDWRRLDA
ncbi:hypothetical protein J2X65_003150 [Ancylobacter sp. 3268]|uniref:phage tail terminator-like protein n=1 Tax=Ancylobacter sp. 3268 TaxID=2817752 RepID=UPI00286662AB|nr:phage tail terminator-like protein [Ancylobacter sp. 3268]MDR6953787.1 hypothetical protein [Ancylobacter sp. 3268]